MRLRIGWLCMTRRYKCLMRTQKVDLPVDQRNTLGFMRMGMRCGRTFPSRAVQSHCNSYSISLSPSFLFPFQKIHFFDPLDRYMFPSHLEQSSSYSNSISHSTPFPFSFWKVHFFDLQHLCISPLHLGQSCFYCNSISPFPPLSTPLSEGPLF